MKVRNNVWWLGLCRYANLGWVRCLTLIVLGCGVHIPALSGELLWDDIPLISKNPLIRSPILTLEAFSHYLFPDSTDGHYRPVQTISYIFDYFLWNGEAFGYHLTNVALHVLSGVLLYYLSCRILGSFAARWPAQLDRIRIETVSFFLALLWVVHPVHSAAVDYVSGRADSLAFVFAVAGWLLYLRADGLPTSWIRRALYFLTIICAFLSLCSRESGGLWILLFLLYSFAFDEKPACRGKYIALVSCLLVVCLYSGFRQLPENHSQTGAPTGWPPALRGLLMLRALGDYGRLMLFPSQLHVERTVYVPTLNVSEAGQYTAILNDYLSILGVIVLVVLVFGALRKGIGRRTRLFGASWFLITYLPISNLFDLNATVAEHWLYVPSVGILIFFAGIFFDLPKRYHRIAVATAFVAILGFSVRSTIRSTDWVDPETFFRRTFAAGGSSSRIGVNLGVVYALRGEDAKAESILRKVLQAFPDYPLARNNLGIALLRQGKTSEAEALFNTANSATTPAKGGYPQTSDAARNLARLRHHEKDDFAALAILARARRDYPSNWELVALQAEIIRETEGPTMALVVVKDFVRDHWWHYGASIALGGLLLEVGDMPRAENAFWHASALDVHDTEAFNLIALLNVRQGQLEKAYSTQRRAVARQPKEPRQYLILSDILGKMGRSDEAHEMLERASRLESTARQVVAN